MAIDLTATKQNRKLAGPLLAHVQKNASLPLLLPRTIDGT